MLAPNGYKHFILFKFSDTRLFGRVFYRNATISTATSAGDTPEILDACPRFSGRISDNFCLASMRSAFIDS